MRLGLGEEDLVQIDDQTGQERADYPREVDLSMTTVAQYFAQQLAAWGFRHVYGVIGDTLFPLMDAIAAEPRLRFIPVRHEAAAGFMASAEAKLTGRPAVCIATSGPGIANLLNGLGDAYADRLPLLALTGQVESRQIGTNAKQYVDQQGLIRPLAGFTELLAHPDAAGSLLPAALRACLAQSQVAHLSVPKDLWAQPCTATLIPPEPFLTAPPAPDPAAMAGALDLMRKAKRPMLLLGEGARPAQEALLQLAERWGAGLIHSMPAIGIVPRSHPLALGGLGAAGSEASHAALAEADLLLTVACNWWPKRYVPEHVSVIKVDRQPIAVGGAMAVELGVPGLAEVIVPQLAEGILSPPANGTAPQPTERSSTDLRAEWRARLKTLKSDWDTQVAQEAAPGGSPLSPQQIVRAIEEALPPDGIIALDTGDHTVWFGRIFGGSAHQVLLSGRWRSLGFGLPAAMAAKLCEPERTVVALVGDTGLQSLLGELVTAAELGLPLTVVVVNNGQMAIERNRARAQGHSLLGTAPPGPDFGLLATACGLRSMRVSTNEELAEALHWGLISNGPFLINAIASAPMAPTSRS